MSRQSGIKGVNRRGIAVGTPAFLALSCIGAFATSPAFADEAALADESVTTLAADAQGGGRTDIIVNGERQEVSAKDVAPPINTPRSVITVSSSVIEQTGSNSLADALRTVPGITFGASEGGNPVGDRPFIRGFDAQGSIFVDGVRDLASQSREVFAIDSVQIVPRLGFDAWRSRLCRRHYQHRHQAAPARDLRDRVGQLWQRRLQARDR